MKLPDLTVTVLDAVGELLGQQLLQRDARLQALEGRPLPEPGAPGRQGDKGDTGDKGDRGDTGDAGAAGIGVDSPAWKTGVHRAGVIAQHHLGQHFRALVDTASEPPGADWQRVGSGGFRLTGGFTEGRQYEDGDLFVRDFGLFLQHKGEAHLWAGRGGKGDPGPRGLPGDPGKDGKDGLDGAVLQAIEVRGATLVVVQRRPSGALSELVVDLMPFLEATTFALQDKFDAQLQQLRNECEERIAKALQQAATPRNGRAGHQPPPKDAQ
jgi:hypothetical protein